MDICMDSPTCGQLNVFHAIAQEGSISAGGRKLGMTAPSASHALKQLELKMGVPLLQRATRQIGLTVAGALLLERTRDAPHTLQHAVRAGLGLGRIFEPICALQPDRENFMPVLQTHWRSYPAVHLYYLQNSQKAGRTQTLIAFCRIGRGVAGCRRPVCCKEKPHERRYSRQIQTRYSPRNPAAAKRHFAVHGK